MNNTITLSQLITRLAAVTGVDNNTARRFLRALFSTVEDSLAAGHSVTIKGIGTFRPVNDELGNNGTTVAFTPDKEIAAELNRPFEMFSAVELADGVSFNDNEQKEAEVTATTAETTAPDTFVTIEETTEDQTDDEQPAPGPVTDDVPLPQPQNLRWPEEEEEEAEAQVTPQEIPQDTHQDTHQDTTGDIAGNNVGEPEDGSGDESDTPEETPKRNLLWLWIALILVFVCVGAYLAAVYTTPIGPRYEEEEETETAPDSTLIEEVTVDQVATTESPAATPAEAAPATQPATQPAPQPAAEPTLAKEPVYDTVEVSLIRLAKKHYGESSYWVFIFEANSNTISNPNCIRPGQKVIIPDESTFPGANKAETRAIAKQKQTELLNRFK